MAFNTGKYEAIDYLNSNQRCLGALAKGNRRCLCRKQTTRRGFEKLFKSSWANKNDFTTPRFLLKAGKQL
jgi:hypothetical protein